MTDLDSRLQDSLHEVASQVVVDNPPTAADLRRDGRPRRRTMLMPVASCALACAVITGGAAYLGANHSGSHSPSATGTAAGVDAVLAVDTEKLPAKPTEKITGTVQFRIVASRACVKVGRVHLVWPPGSRVVIGRDGRPTVLSPKGKPLAKIGERRIAVGQRAKVPVRAPAGPCLRPGDEVLRVVNGPLAPGVPPPVYPGGPRPTPLPLPRPSGAKREVAPKVRPPSPSPPRLGPAGRAPRVVEPTRIPPPRPAPPGRVAPRVVVTPTQPRTSQCRRARATAICRVPIPTITPTRH